MNIGKNMKMEKIYILKIIIDNFHFNNVYIIIIEEFQKQNKYEVYVIQMIKYYVL